MPKFSGPQSSTLLQGPVRSTGERLRTHEGGVGRARDAKSELFLLAVTNMVGEDAFYESGKQRDNRFVALVHQVTQEDPDWVARFVPYLRDTLNMRSASVVMAAEYVKAGGPSGRKVVASACVRADEPGEMLGYWLAVHGRKLPQPLKRGIADAAARLYNERNLIKYDGQSKGVRFADVLELCHVRPRFAAQHALFRYALDRRHNRADVRIGEELTTISADRALLAVPEDGRRVLLREDPRRLGDASWTWERLAGWLPGGMDAEAWEFAIPQMGYMSLLRNLRNFDQASVADSVLQGVADKLANADEVAKSRQLPLRFLSAWKAAPSMRWGAALEQALQHSLANVPTLHGRTCVLIDVSGSMHDRLSARSELARWEAAATFGYAFALRNDADVYLYANDLRPVDLRPASSVLRAVEGTRGQIGGGTMTMAAIATAYKDHQRVLVLTDEQAHDTGRISVDHVPLIYTFNLAGYRPGHLSDGRDGRYTFGGLTDQAFTMLEQLEARRDGTWPF